jgi:hypothetical protein
MLRPRPSTDRPRDHAERARGVMHYAVASMGVHASAHHGELRHEQFGAAFWEVGVAPPTRLEWPSLAGGMRRA